MLRKRKYHEYKESKGHKMEILISKLTAETLLFEFLIAAMKFTEKLFFYYSSFIFILHL